MATFWRRLPIWADWVVASIAAVVVYNVNVTKAGAPLSGPRPGPTPFGITEGGRTAFYGSLVVGALVLVAAGLVVVAMNGRRNRVLGGLVVRTYAGVAFAGLLGLLLDYRNGPVSTVHSFVYLMLSLGIFRLARIGALAIDDDEGA